MSKIEVNTVEPQCGTTLTLGASGDTVALGSGASQTGFGRTGTVDWITTPKVTGDSPITAVTGKGYFLNTTAGTITVNLPAGAAGSIVSLADYAATWQTNNVTVAANGSEKIGGSNANATLSTEGQSVTFVYVDSTQGWINTMDSTSNVRGSTFVTATVSGACNTLVTVDTDYKLATFVGPGTLCVSCGGNTSGSNSVDYLVIAGGGGGGYCMGGAGGGGGYRESPGTASGSYTVSPLGVAPAVALPVSVQGYTVTVGGGGAGSTSAAKGISGVDSTFSTITSAGGGGAGSRSPSFPPTIGVPGGSGGGSANDSPPANANPTGNTPPVSPPQGNQGGFGRGDTGINTSGGGGGATTAGGDGTGPGPAPTMGPGGAGATSSINGTPTGRAGGGSGGLYSSPGSQSAGTVSDGGGLGGPGAANGTINTGGGGGGGGHTSDGGTQVGGTGGSGIVIIRYKFQ